MAMNRSYKRRPRFVSAKDNNESRPYGGAVPGVQKRFEMAQNAASRNEFPLLASLIYSAPPIVQYPPEFSSGGNVMVPGGGMINRLYQPEAPQPRSIADKLESWMKTGRFE